MYERWISIISACDRNNLVYIVVFVVFVVYVIGLKSKISLKVMEYSVS